MRGKRLLKEEGTEGVMRNIKKIGWIGTGIMGKSMCRRLIEAGYEVALFTRTRRKAEELIDAGATWCGSPRAVAERSDCTFTIVGYPRDVREVVLGENGVLSGARSGSVIVDMTTSQPQLAEEIAAAASAKGVAALDAPVSGGDVGARDGTLAIMCGGEGAAYDSVLPLFQCMGENIELLGGPGRGQHAKMCNQILVAAGIVGTVESLLYAYKSGMNAEQVIRIVGSGAAGSWAINNLGPRIAARDFAPGFMIKHFIKDMAIALDEAERMELSLPGLALTQEFYKAASAQGLGELGTHGLYMVLARLNGIET